MVQTAAGNKPKLLGRPRTVASPAYAERLIGDYLKECRKGNDKLTISGIALTLGFNSVQSLYDYENREEYSALIKRARLIVANGYEKKLHGTNVTGAIFALKNMGWKDTTTNESRQLRVNVTAASKEVEGFSKYLAEVTKNKTEQ